MILVLGFSACAGTQDGDGRNEMGEMQNNGTAGNGSALDYANLTPEQQAALAACEQATGQRSFDNCPVNVLCSSLSPSSVLPIVVTFEALTNTCPWTNQNDPSGPEDVNNLSVRNRYTRARVEQVRDLAPSLAVPEGQAAVFCSVDISVRSLRPDGLFRYDDDLLFLFGGKDATSGAVGGALLTTRNRDMPNSMMKPVTELPGVSWPQYSWPSIVNTELSNDAPQLYCLGQESADPNNPSCNIPETQQSGEFFIRMSSELAGRLGLRAALNKNYNLSVVVTGDNDAEPDCKHDGFEATVNVGYILLPELSLPGLI